MAKKEKKKRSKTVRILRIIMPLAGISSAIFLAPWLIIWAWILPLPDTIQDQVNEGISHGIDGIIVYVDQGGGEPAWYTGGYTNRQNKVPTSPDLLFKIASISKLYVAVSITRLVHSQQLAMDQTLARHFPELVGRIENAEKITLRNMIMHRSGIPNLTDHPDFPWDNPPKSSMEALEYALDLPAEFAPDTDYAYSNTNYLLLSELIDKVTGKPHFQYIKSQILEPLGLSNTYPSIADVDMDRLMGGYFEGYEPDIKGENYGSMLATAEDVGIFLRALNTGTLLSKEEQATYSSVYVFKHTGHLPGYQSYARYDKELDAVVILFMNTSGGLMWNVGEVVYNRIFKILRRQAKAS